MFATWSYALLWAAFVALLSLLALVLACGVVALLAAFFRAMAR